VNRPPATSRRDDILAAVVGVIIDIGFTAMTVGDVAQRAGISTSLVHYHFDSKTALITAALRVALDDDKAWRDTIAAAQGTAPERLERMLCGSLPGTATDDASWVLWIETWGEARHNPDIKALMIEQIEHERRILVDLIGEGSAAGQVTCADHHAAAARLMALRDGLAVEHTLFEAAEPAEIMVARLRAALAAELGLRHAG
jgi:AcrR family transcriptional regulator